jgi:hypothetical protein
VHKSMCKRFLDFAESGMFANWRRVVVLLPGNPEPQFNWTPAKVDEEGHEHIHPSDLIQASGHLTWTWIDNRTNGWTGQDLGYEIQVWHDIEFMGKYRRPDPAVFAATRGLETAGWCGPLVVCCRSIPRAHSGERAKVLDMDTRTFSHLASFLVDYSNTDPDHIFRMGPKVQCVELSCGQAGLSAEAHKVVHLPRTHPLYPQESLVSQVSMVSPFRQ